MAMMAGGGDGSTKTRSNAFPLYSSRSRVLYTLPHLLGHMTSMPSSSFFVVLARGCACGSKIPLLLRHQPHVAVAQATTPTPPLTPLLA